MKGKTNDPSKIAWIEKFTKTLEDGIKNAESVILANRQLLEEKIVTSNLEEALGSIREAIGMPTNGFASMQEAILWLHGATVPFEVQAYRQKELDTWIRIIQREFQLADNYRSAIRNYLCTGEIQSIQANASIEIDFQKWDVKIVEHDRVRDSEMPYLRKMADQLLEKIGRTVKRFGLTNHRSHDPKKHARAMAILHSDKQNKISDIELANELDIDFSSDDYLNIRKQDQEALSIIKNTRYNKKKRKKG